MGKVHPLEIYKDSNKEWRWRIEANNGNVIGGSTEGYKNKGDMIDNLKSIEKSISAFFSEEEE